MTAYSPKTLPDAYGTLDYSSFLDELIDASAALEVYREKIKDSKVDSRWFLPTLQQRDAIASLKIEGTQATLDGVLVNQVEPNKRDNNVKEVLNYIEASEIGCARLRRGDFDRELFCEIHKTLLSGSVRKNSKGTIGAYRTDQNYIGRNEGELVYTPPKPEEVPGLMDNLIAYINEDDQKMRSLLRIAIIHAQFETIHPFDDGNGRVGRILIPLYLYVKNEIPLPYFFISEALERDKLKYYKLLMDTREPGRWNEWIRFFLETVSKQCRRHIGIIDDINRFYDKVAEQARQLFKSTLIVRLLDIMFQKPVFSAKVLHIQTGIPVTTINRYLNKLADHNLIYSAGKKRNRIFFFYDLLNLLKE